MNKLAVITGATKGIGKALVKTFAENGFDIAACSRSVKDLQQLKEEVEEENKVDVHVKEVDVANKEQVLSFAGFVKTIARLEVLINNAGLFVPGQLLTEEDGVLEKTMETNLYSAYHLTRALSDTMVGNKSGHIFNICSTASFVPYTNGGSYCISKFALLGMSKVLREEMKKHGVRVTSVMPGATYTASWEGAEIPEDRFMPARDVAAAIWQAYALSERTVLEELILRPQLGDI